MAFDHTVLWQQITPLTRVELRILSHETVHDATSLHFLVGNRRSQRKMIVTYNGGSDTYTVTVGRVNRALDWEVEDTAEEITVDRLNATLRELFSKVTS